MKKTYIILGSIAAVVLAVYLLLPDVLFEELVFPLEKGSTVLAYDDRADGGESSTTFKVTDSELSFECSLGADTAKSSWCGLLWNFDPDSLKQFRNWIFVDSLIFDLDVSGTREVLVKLWAYDPDVTDIRKPKTFRLLMKEMPLHEGHNRVSIPMEQLYTPEFWSEDLKSDVNLKQRHHETMARLEIAPGWNQARGTTFSLKIHSIKAVGVSNFSYGIVLAIFVVLTIVAVGWRHKVKNDEE